VIEIAALGPGPFSGMLLADMGAEVIVVDRPRPPAWLPDPTTDLTRRGRRSIAVDLKSVGGAEVVLRLAASAEALIEGFRPGVMERAGIGPAEVLARNPAIVYGRVTGWGQDGPLAQAAGHDIDYIAVAGTLDSIGPGGGPPVPPLNLLGDFGGGGMLLAFGLLCGVLHARQTGRGQVIDASMVDGVALLSTALHSARAAGWWSDERGDNLLDGGSPLYRVYECAGGGYLAVGALEPQFAARLLDRLGITPDAPRDAFDRSTWEVLGRQLERVFLERSRDEWCALLTGDDCCVAPVLTAAEAPGHPHNAARRTFIAPGGITQPAPAPRFTRTPGAVGTPPPRPGADTIDLLAEVGYSPSEIEGLLDNGSVALGL
jgi:alpha-methylacyl-CoA racemase